MATNMALKRARKAQRRKHVLRAAHAPVQHCFLTESVFDIGMGTLVVARGATLHHIALSSFLIDVFCLGIKDVMFESVESEVFEMYMDASGAGSPMVSVDPGYARKLLRDLAAWSQSIGLAQATRCFGSVATASLSIFPVRTTPLRSFSGGSNNFRSISAMMDSDSKRRPEADPVPSHALPCWSWNDSSFFL
jgi:hypothetical protein